jgi:hypothetical protein
MTYFFYISNTSFMMTMEGKKTHAAKVAIKMFLPYWLMAASDSTSGPGDVSIL